MACNRLITSDDKREIKIKKIEDCQIGQHKMHDKPDARLAKPEDNTLRFLSLLKKLVDFSGIGRDGHIPPVLPGLSDSGLFK